MTRCWLDRLPPRPQDDDAKYWNAYWQVMIEEIVPGKWNSDLRPLTFHHEICQIPELRGRGISNLLFLGNGIAQTPRAFAFAGFHVVALDCSAIATDFAREYRLTQDELRLFFQTSYDWSRHAGDYSSEYAREGGTVRFVTGDFMDPAVEPGPFGCIIADRSLQGARARQTRHVVELIDRRLASGGVVDIIVQNASELCSEYRELLAERGYSEDPALRSSKLACCCVASG